MTLGTVLFVFVFVMVLSVLLSLAYDIGRERGRIDCAPEFEAHDRYRMAVEDLDVWCGYEFPQARLIAAHLLAIGEGTELNAGTPCGDEPCTISGLREQLRRGRSLMAARVADPSDKTPWQL